MGIESEAACDERIEAGMSAKIMDPPPDLVCAGIYGNAEAQQPYAGLENAL